LLLARQDADDLPALPAHGLQPPPPREGKRLPQGTGPDRSQGHAAQPDRALLRLLPGVEDLAPDPQRFDRPVRRLGAGRPPRQAPATRSTRPHRTATPAPPPPAAALPAPAPGSAGRAGSCTGRAGRTRPAAGTAERCWGSTVPAGASRLPPAGGRWLPCPRGFA